MKINYYYYYYGYYYLYVNSNLKKCNYETEVIGILTLCEQIHNIYLIFVTVANYLYVA